MAKFKPFVINLEDGRRVKVKYECYEFDGCYILLTLQKKKMFFWSTLDVINCGRDIKLITSNKFMSVVSQFVMDYDEKNREQQELDQCISKISKQTIDTDVYNVMTKLSQG